MTDRPIIFSAPMVRALMDGRKTQTRRMLNPQPSKWEARVIDITTPFFCEDEGEWGQVETIWNRCSAMWEPESEIWRPLRLRYAPGDRLYVREAFAVRDVYSDVVEVGYAAHERASHTEYVEQWPVASAIDAKGRAPKVTWPKHRPSIHMPRWASRMTLMVTDVRVERLQDISESDAAAEGIGQYGRFFGLPDADWDSAELTAQAAFRRLWNSLHAAPGTTWDANPWLVAVTFEVIRANIDTLDPPTAASGASASAVSPLDQRAKEAGALVGEPVQ